MFPGESWGKAKLAMWCLEAVSRVEATSKQIFTALVSVLVLVLSQDRDQDTNLQGKTRRSAY